MYSKSPHRRVEAIEIIHTSLPPMPVHFVFHVLQIAALRVQKQQNVYFSEHTGSVSMGRRQLLTAASFIQ